MKYPAICINTFYFYSEISTLHLKQEYFLAAKKKKVIQDLFFSSSL